jgi:NAD(P)-dependent dehydrogenase (short-subunit alcohol dehydrogenase family)
MFMAFERYSLSGRTALITGSAGLLGIHHASALLEAGAQVVLTDIRMGDLLAAKEKLSELYNEQLIYIHTMDVTNKENIQEIFENLSAKNIRIDILINNAAIDPKVDGDSGVVESTRLEGFDLFQWNLQINVGLTGAFLCSQIFGTAMAHDGKGGVILNIASDLSVISPDQRLYSKEGVKKDFQPVKPVTYSVIKAGLVGLTKYLATYWPDDGVRCNALSPGGVYNGQGDDFTSRLQSLIPMGRMAEKDEYRGTVQYMCSDASSYMNGQNIVVDGGRSVW